MSLSAHLESVSLSVYLCVCLPFVACRVLICLLALLCSCLPRVVLLCACLWRFFQRKGGADELVGQDLHHQPAQSRSLCLCVCAHVQAYMALRKMMDPTARLIGEQQQQHQEAIDGPHSVKHKRSIWHEPILSVSTFCCCAFVGLSRSCVCASTSFLEYLFGILAQWAADTKPRATCHCTCLVNAFRAMCTQDIMFPFGDRGFLFVIFSKSYTSLLRPFLIHMPFNLGLTTPCIHASDTWGHTPVSLSNFNLLLMTTRSMCDISLATS